MELLLLNLAAFVRPLASIRYAETLFTVLGAALFGALVAGLLIRLAAHKSLRLSGIDAIIIAFTAWCLAISIIYMDNTRMGEVGKLLIPLLSYTIVKNLVSTLQEYRNLLLVMIAGFALPTLWSAFWIVTDNPAAIDMVNYWTGVKRWEGVYNHSHTLGHSMTLLLMTLVVWLALGGQGKGDKQGVPRVFVYSCSGAMALVSLYCLYMSQVRSALLGLLTFVLVYLFFYNRRLLLIGSSAAALFALLTVSYWLPGLAPELYYRGHELSALDVGSGRPRIWLHDLTVFAGLPLDQKIAGVGIGAIENVGDGYNLYGHNDWLGFLTQTGVVGLALFAALQVAILRAILLMRGKERYLFLALFIAVNVMMAVSNSYAWRIQVSHLYYMILAFIEVPHTRVVAEPVGARRVVGIGLNE